MGRQHASPKAPDYRPTPKPHSKSHVHSIAPFLSGKRLRLLKWLGPLILGNLGLLLLLSNPRDGIHCSVFLPPESRAASAPFSTSANGKLLSWAVDRGLALSPSVGLASLPDVSYSGSEHARDDFLRRQARAGLLATSTSTGAAEGATQVALDEHGWGLEGALRRPHVRGLVAKKPLESGDRVCLLPLSLALRANKVNLSIAPQAPLSEPAAGEPLPRLPPDMERLAVVLLREKAAGSSSPWALYINALPLAVPLPLMLLPEELRHIQWAWTQSAVRTMQRETQGSFDFVARTGVLHPAPDFHTFRWAVSIVQSRAFRIPFKGERREEKKAQKGEQEGELVLMPFMDAINHHYRNHIDWMAKPISESNTLEMVLKRPAKRGEQIFTSFGPRSNDDLFLHYGFLLDSNPFDSLAIFMSFQDAAKWMMDILQVDCDNKFLDVSSSGRGAAFNISDRCPRVNWAEVLTSAKKAAEASKPAKGFERESEHWQELLGEWGALGYEYLPYRPGPNVRPKGVVDPALLSVLSEALQLWQAPLPSWRFPRCAEGQPGRGKGRWLASSTPKASTCCRGSEGEVRCPGAANEKATAAATYIRMAVVHRCRQILVSMPTSVTEDRKLLREISFKSADGSGAGCTVGHSKMNDAWMLAVRYRLQKKEMLLEVIHRYSEKL